MDSAASGHVVLDENGNRKTDIDVVYIEGGAVGDPTTFEESAAGTFRASTSGDVELLDGCVRAQRGAGTPKKEDHLQRAPPPTNYFLLASVAGTWR